MRRIVCCVTATPALRARLTLPSRQRCQRAEQVARAACTVRQCTTIGLNDLEDHVTTRANRPLYRRMRRVILFKGLSSGLPPRHGHTARRLQSRCAHSSAQPRGFDNQGPKPAVTRWDLVQSLNGVGRYKPYTRRNRLQSCLGCSTAAPGPHRLTNFLQSATTYTPWEQPIAWSLDHRVSLATHHVRNA